MKKIAIFQSDLHVGGIQKSLVNFLTMLPKDEFDLDVYLCDLTSFYDISGVDENVHFYQMQSLPFLNRFLSFNIVKRLYKGKFPKTKYDVAIDFNSYRNECAIGALQVDAKKRVMWIHNDVEIKRKEELKYRILWHFFRKKFQYFDEFAAVSAGVIPSFKRMAKIEDKPIHVIPNFINSKEIHEKICFDVNFKVDSSKYNFVSMGRLCHQKGFDILFNEYLQVLNKRKDTHLYIIGDGPDRNQLETQCRELGIEPYVTFLGNQANPFPYLKQMDGFVLDSRYEGQGMVLWEAKAIGLELFFPTRLEPYNDGLKGRENLVQSMSMAEKRALQTETLEEYNRNILEQLRKLFLKAAGREGITSDSQ